MKSKDEITTAAGRMDLKRIRGLTVHAYNATAEKYHDAFKDEVAQKPFDRELLEKFSDALPRQSLICDAGCGPSAHIGRFLQGRGHRVVGIDVAERCVELAAAWNPAMPFSLMDMMETGFVDAAFDGLIAFYSIIYTPRGDALKIFREFRRILKPGGTLLLAVKKGEQEGFVDDEWYEGNSVYFTHFLETDLQRYCAAAGLEAVSIETRRPYPFEINVDRIFLIAANPREATFS